jgi:AraC family transcriptional regulator, ethanolamine operon transcriptional activator
MIQIRFAEYEEYAAAVSEVSVEMRLSSLDESRWMLQNLTIGGVRLQMGIEGGGTIAEGATVPDGWTLFHQPKPVLVNSELVDEDDVFIVPPGREFCLASHFAHDWFMVVIPTSQLFPPKTTQNRHTAVSPQAVSPPGQLTRTFASLIRRIFSAAEQRPQIVGFPTAMEAIQYELLNVSRAFLPFLSKAVGRHFVRWHRQTKAVAECCFSHFDQSLSIADLSQHCGIPERSLRTAFQRCFGLSPFEYLRLQRLHRARKLLSSKGPDETTVSKIAFELGFWELGRFAATYRRLFGERPSETLKRKRPTRL